MMYEVRRNFFADGTLASVFATVLAASAPAYAQTDAALFYDGRPFAEFELPAGSSRITDPVVVDDAASRRVISAIPGESIDPRTGVLSLTATDLVVPGNGSMDLVVSRSRRGTYFQSPHATYEADYSFQEGIADWRLDVPFVQIAALAGQAWGFPPNNWPNNAFTYSMHNGSFAGACSAPYPWINSSDGLRYFRGVTVVGLPNQGPKELLRRNLEWDAYLNAPYATADHWIADCAGSEYNSAAQARFVVHSPDGTTYYFDEPTVGNNYPAFNDDGDPIPTLGYLRIFVSKIVDRNGNWISYEYDNASFSANVQQNPQLRDFAYVERIVTNDGREVSFDWEANPFCQFPDRQEPVVRCSPMVGGERVHWDGIGLNGAPFQRLKSFTSNGRTWEFKYNDSAAAPDTSRYLKEVILPGGQSWNYTVTAGQTAQSAPCSYPYPMQATDYDVKFPDGGVVDYTMSWRWLERDDGSYSSAASCWPVSAVEKRTVDDLGSAPTSITQWCYAPGKTSDALWTYMLTPSRMEAYKFHGQIGDDQHWKEGLMAESQIRAVRDECPISDDDVVDPGAGYRRKTTYEYVAGTRFSKPGAFDFDIPAYPKSLSRPRALSKRTIHQPDAGTFATTWGTFDDYFMPQLMSETSAYGLTRRWRTNYDQRMSRDADNNEVTLLLGLASEHCLVSTDSETACPLSDDVVQGDVSSYDDAGNLLSIASYGKTKAYTYHPSGDLQTATDERLKTTTFSNYKRGIAQTTTLPDNNELVAVVNNTGTIESIRNARLNTTSYGYDDRDRLQSVDYPLGSDTSILWSADGRTKTTTRGASKSIMMFDGFGRLVQEEAQDAKKGDKIVKIHKFDSSGRPSFDSYASKSLGEATRGFQYFHDELDRRYKTTRTTDSAYTLTTYSVPEKQSIRDFNGATTTTTSRSFGFPSYDQLMSTSTPTSGNDAAGNPTSTTVATSFTRDLLGFATDATQGGVVRRFSLDNRRLVTSEFVPELGASAAISMPAAAGPGPTPLEGVYNVSYCRDDAGNVRGKAIGSECSMDGNVVQVVSGTCSSVQGGATPESLDSTSCSLTSPIHANVFDDRGRLSTVTYTDGVTPNVSIVYTPTSKVDTLFKGGVVIDMDYDDNENMLNETFKLDGFKFRLGYAYDGLDHLKSMQYPSGKTYQLGPDALGRPRQLTGVVTSATFHPSGWPDRIEYQNGEVTEIQPTQENYVDTILTTSNHGAFAVSLTYDYDSNGNVTMMIDSTRSNDTTTFDYDELNRQIKTTYPNASPGLAYYRGYDRVGNVLFDQTPGTALTMGYDAATNRLKSIDSDGITRTLSYDTFGNMKGDGLRALAFDSAGNLSSSQSPVQKTFTYDGRDRLVKRVDAQGTTYFIYSGVRSSWSSTRQPRIGTPSISTFRDNWPVRVWLRKQL